MKLKYEVKKHVKAEGWGSSHDSKGNIDWQEKMDRYQKMKANGNINQIINKIIYSKKNDQKKKAQASPINQRYKLGLMPEYGITPIEIDIRRVEDERYLKNKTVENSNIIQPGLMPKMDNLDPNTKKINDEESANSYGMIMSDLTSN